MLFPKGPRGMRNGGQRAFEKRIMLSLPLAIALPSSNTSLPAGALTNSVIITEDPRFLDSSPSCVRLMVYESLGVSHQAIMRSRQQVK
jgi:hypothetical protein